MQTLWFILWFFFSSTALLIGLSYTKTLKSNTLTLMALTIYAGALVLNTPAPQLATILIVSLLGYVFAFCLRWAFLGFDLSQLKDYQEPLLVFAVTLLIYVLFFWVPALEKLHQSPMAWWHGLIGLAIFSTYYSFVRFVKKP